MADTDYSILKQIQNPNDFRRFNDFQLEQLSHQLRNYIIDSVSKNPGHLGANLGVIELTVALHYVYNTPFDKIIWDVGHQAYGHKILTGRRDLFDTNRKLNGISGFPKIDESPYDAFGVGHSSTSISAALGMAIASKLQNDNKRNHIAVIGDGAITAGMAFEALNHAGWLNANLLVILNDNSIAIDPSVGAVKEYFTDITTSKTYNRLKDEIWNALGVVSRYGPNTRALIQKFENAVKSMLLKQSNMFEALNFRYFGTIDGHDIFRLVRVLQDIKNIPGPKLLHINTIKGKGLEEAEKNQTKFHAPGLFDKNSGKIILPADYNKPQPPLYQDVFGETLLELAIDNKKIVAITPAMASGCGMQNMMKKIPERTFDVGIAEQHAVTFSAGLAIQGMLPYCNIYSTFMQRAYDQIIHDVALQNLPVVFCLDRGGLVGEDGATHQGVFDMAYLRIIPNIIIASPIDEIEFRNLLYTAQFTKQPFAIRYSKGRGRHVYWKSKYQKLPIGKGEMLISGKDVAVLTIGKMGIFAENAINDLQKQGFNPSLYNMRFVKPLDTMMLHKICKSYSQILTIEDGVLQGGFGSAVTEFVMDNDYQIPVKRLGISDEFVEHGKQQQLYELCGIDQKSIQKCIARLYANLPVAKIS